MSSPADRLRAAAGTVGELFGSGRSACSHLDQALMVEAGSDGCEDCLAIGGTWVHLRLCLACGHVGCCDQSPNRHATAHFRESGHPIIRSFEPGETWAWCYIDEVNL